MQRSRYAIPLRRSAQLVKKRYNASCVCPRKEKGGLQLCSCPSVLLFQRSGCRRRLSKMGDPNLLACVIRTVQQHLNLFKAIGPACETHILWLSPAPKHHGRGSAPPSGQAWPQAHSHHSATTTYQYAINTVWAEIRTSGMHSVVLIPSPCIYHTH